MAEETGNKKMTYKESGVDYYLMDPVKKLAQLAGLGTAHNLDRFGKEFKEVEESRGTSVHLVERKTEYSAHVIEGLGTKNLVADAMYGFENKPYYFKIAQDCVAMIVNDMITAGALPTTVAMHLAVGSSDWFKDPVKYESLISGWANACNLARCIYACGETPTLKDIIYPDVIELSGSAAGFIKPKKRRIVERKIRRGDRIIFIESSGICANGLTLARKISDKLDEGYLKVLPDGRTYGESLLDPTYIYVGLVEDCLNEGVDIHYAENITGHGWRKLMRPKKNFLYVIEQLPHQLPIFDFIQKYGPMDDDEAYANLNMGAGFALYAPRSEVKKIIEIAKSLELTAFDAGYIVPSPKKVLYIEPKGLTFEGDSLDIR